MNTHETKALVIIDPQNDFIDQHADGFTPALGVPGAYNDMQNIIKFIEQENPNQIFVTLDSHDLYDIAHPAWWKDEQGNHPGHFTLISLDDVQSNKWTPVDSTKLDYAKTYLKSLEDNNQYQHRIWPPHCLNNTHGHQIQVDLQNALQAWELKNNKKVVYVRKGENPNTEHFSAFKAEYVLDSYTELNKSLIEQIASYDKTFWTGEAASHCVASSMKDYLPNVPDEKVKSTYVLTDCMSSVVGCDSLTEDFFNYCKSVSSNLQTVEKKPKNKIS